MVSAVRSAVYYADSDDMWSGLIRKGGDVRKSKEQWLRKYIKLENGVPDACTSRNVIRAIDTQQLHAVFVKWMKTVVEQARGVVAIDGKQARRTKDTKKPPLHVVRAFSAERSLVLGQLACEEKSNEITAIPKLLEMLEITGCIVTIDAMGTQSEIEKKITEKGADYILALKENQKTLYEDVRMYFEEYRKSPTGVDPDCYAMSHSQGHGRFESRTCYVSEEIGWLESRGKWSGLAGIGAIFCKVEQAGKVSTQARYFIYSRKGMTASQILVAKRSHWSIAELQDAERQKIKTGRINKKAGWTVMQTASPLFCESKKLIEQRLTGKLRHFRSFITF